MKNKAVREIKNIAFNQDDVLVIFGEVFPGGYVTGLIASAKAKGMNIIYSTVGRRSEDGTLRPLNKEELNQKPKPLINIPLEAGFDNTPSEQGAAPVVMCQDISLKNWQTAKLDKNLLKSAQKKSVQDFKERTKKWLKELEKLLPPKGNVLIAHTMAGGVPRAKILLPILNRVLKGAGHRFSSSKVFWESDLGFLCRENFNEVTAHTYQYLLEQSQFLREKLQKQGRKVFYTAYSYRGTEVFIEDKYQWQSYAPYLQGWAKLKLEEISKEFSQQGVNASVFNVPEILTKSSAIFPGVEIPLYPILKSLKEEGGAEGERVFSECMGQLKENSFKNIMEITKFFFKNPALKNQMDPEKWPQHNNPEQMELMLSTSKNLSQLHKDSSLNITPILSSVILRACGRLILQESIRPQNSWIGHDVVAKDLKQRN